MSPTAMIGSPVLRHRWDVHEGGCPKCSAPTSLEVREDGPWMAFCTDDACSWAAAGDESGPHPLTPA